MRTLLKVLLVLILWQTGILMVSCDAATNRDDRSFIMAICPNCHTMDKGFFAPKCHSCNTEVGFIEQMLTSLVWWTTTIVVGYIILRLIFG